MKRTRSQTALLIGVLLSCVLAATSAPAAVANESRPTTTTITTIAPTTVNALRAARGLTVKGRAPKTGYERSQFGSGWKDPDRNGCDARNDALRRWLRAVVMRPGSTCVVLSGTLTDPYTGETVSFVRGGARDVDIDHVVSLSDAWQKGAQRLPYDTRVRFANDPLNLMPVAARVNAAKSDGDAATWLPPRKGYRCAFLARQVAVKMRYALWVTAAEQAAMVRILSGCPTMTLPAR